MKHKFWTKHLCVVSMVTLVMPIDLMKLEAAVPTDLLLTQAQFSYDRYIAKADIKERAAIYAMSGFLPDALTTLAQLRRERPNDADLKTDWQDLLRSAGLEGIAQAPKGAMLQSIISCKICFSVVVVCAITGFTCIQSGFSGIEPSYLFST